MCLHLDLNIKYETPSQQKEKCKKKKKSLVIYMTWLTLSEKTLHLLTCLIVVKNDIKAQVLEALVKLACISIRAVAYIHPCQKRTLTLQTQYAITLSQTEFIRLSKVCYTRLFIKVFVIDDDALSHSPVAHLILECWWNNSVMAFRRVVLLPRLAILILPAFIQWQ